MKQKMPRTTTTAIEDRELLTHEETLKSMNPKEIKEYKEILTSNGNPRLKKFANSHAAYGRIEDYRKAVREVSLKKAAKMLKVLSLLAQTKVYLLWKNPKFS